MTYDYHQLCGICAWRAACQKKFSISHDALHCPDFSRDVTIKSEGTTESTEKDNKRNTEKGCK